jgi:hypothetical protein
MAHRFAANALVFLVIGCNPLGVESAHAALGGDAASVLADAQELHGTTLSTLLIQYDIQEITNDSGMRVREYLARDGVVFAVTWSGPVVPNLKSLLGAHFDSYRQALAASKQPGVRRSLRTASPDLVVESSGHMRAYGGRAYLPRLIPAGTSLADIR